MKKKHLLSLILVLVAGIPVTGQEVCLDVDFYEGIPEDFTLECYDQMPVKSQDFKNLYPEMIWFTRGQVDSDDLSAAMSTSHRTIDMPTDNWMITPKLHLSNHDIWLKWTARSIHFHLRDGYKVMISETGTGYDDFTELFSIDEEEYLWTKRIVSLNEYVGKDVYIAFVHNSHNKFMLAIDDMFVGQLSEAEFVVKDETPRFVGNVGTAQVKGQVTNIGAVREDSHLDCVLNGNDTIQDLINPAEVAEAWGTGTSLDFCFDVPVQVGKATHYKILSDDHVILEDSIICSYYPRTLLLEKATGAWCVNCPEVISYIQELEVRYGQELVCVEAHAHYGDLFEYMPYVTGMKTNNFPTIHFNRNQSNPIYGASAKDRATLKKLINKPTIAKVDLTLDKPVGDSVRATSKVTFAVDTDNSTGKFRVGYVLVEKSIQTDLMRQANGSSSVYNNGEYYYMKSPVAADLMWYTNVVRGENNAFVGIKNSLPSAIEAGEEYIVGANVSIPSSVYDRNNLAIIAIVMDYYTNEVLNVAEVKVPEDPESVRPIEHKETGSDISVHLDNANNLHVNSPHQIPFVVEIIAADGRKVVEWQANGSASFGLAPLMEHGLYILRISQNDRVWTRKIAL